MAGEKINARKWIKEHGDGFASLDFKQKELILYDGSFFSIKNKTKLHRKRRNSKYGKDITVSKLACTFYFGSIDETIKYFTNAKKFLNSIGVDTSETLKIESLESKGI